MDCRQRRASSPSTIRGSYSTLGQADSDFEVPAQPGNSSANHTLPYTQDDHNSTIVMPQDFNQPISPWWRGVVLEYWATDYAQSNISSVGLPPFVEDELGGADYESESHQPWIQLGTTATIALLCGTVTRNKQ